MDERSRTEEFEGENMTVIKCSNAVDGHDNSYDNRIIQEDQCKPRDYETKISGDEELQRNILFPADDPESSYESKRENACLLDNSDDMKRDVESYNASKDKENIYCSEELRTGRGSGDDSDLGCQQMDPSARASGSRRDSESSAVSARSIDDEETLRRAREEGQVTVVFPGRIAQDGCCRFVCELFKFVLYQRQQLPMMYDEMVFLQKQQHNATQKEGLMNHRPVKTLGGLDWRRCQRTLQDMDEVLTHLEALFSLSQVPRVLFMLGGSTVLPTELYEVNMEAVAVGAGENSLRTSACLRQLFRTLFVADLLSDAKSVRLMTTTVMVLGHRDCGVTGFKPKVDFKVPTKVRRQVISIASDWSLVGELHKCNQDLKDYIWFQVPVTVKGFCK